MEQFFNVGYVITGFTIFVLVFNQLHIKQVKFAVILLGIWFVRFLLFFLESTQNLNDYPSLVVFDQNLFFLDGVLLYWYIASHNKSISLIKRVIHLIPFILSLVYTSVMYFAYSDEDLVSMYQKMSEELNAGTYTISLRAALNIIIMIGVNFYFFRKSILLIKDYKLLLVNNYSTLNNMQVGWLNRLTYFWFILFYIPFVSAFFTGTFLSSSINTIEIVFYVGMVLIAVIFSFYVIIQEYPSGYLNSKAKDKKPIKVKEIEPELELSYKKVCSFIETNNIYQDESLTLDMLANSIELSTGMLSKVINTGSNTNFHDFINRYRVDAVKKELISSNEQVIIIAYRNGFNSKSTFNSVFKKMTGHTPTQFRKENKHQV